MDRTLLGGAGYMPALTRIATESDEGLLEALRSGDSDATTALIERYYDDVFRFLRHLTRHVQESEDLAQQVLVRVVRGIHRYDGSASLRTWIHRIAYNEFLKWRRSRRIWVALDPRQPSSDKPFESLLEAERLLSALGRLSPKLSAAFLLVEVQELSLAEASIALGIPTGTVKSRLHEAKSKLRQLLCDGSQEWSNGDSAYENR